MAEEDTFLMGAAVAMMLMEVAKKLRGEACDGEEFYVDFVAATLAVYRGAEFPSTASILALIQTPEFMRAARRARDLDLVDVQAAEKKEEGAA